MARGPEHHHHHGRHDGLHGEALRELVLERLAEKAARFDRDDPKGRLKAEALDLLGERIGGLDAWTRLPPQGRRPRLSRDELASTAVRILDAEGHDALSMRRLATELGVGTMSLYHYVRTKDEVLSVAADTVMGEVIVPDDEPLPADWRAAISVVARRSRDCLVRHPWVLDLTGDAPLGPNTVRHFDQTLQAVRGLDAPLDVRLDVVALVDEYVFGSCLLHRDRHLAPAEDEVLDYVSVLVDTGAYPELARLTGELGLPALWSAVMESTAGEDRFDRNLARLLAGISADLEG